MLQSKKRPLKQQSASDRSPKAETSACAGSQDVDASCYLFEPLNTQDQALRKWMGEQAGPCSRAH